MTSEIRYARRPRPRDARADSAPWEKPSRQTPPAVHGREIRRFGRPPHKWTPARAEWRRRRARSPAARDCPEGPIVLVAPRPQNVVVPIALWMISSGDTRLELARNVTQVGEGRGAGHSGAHIGHGVGRGVFRRERRRQSGGIAGNTEDHARWGVQATQ